MTRRRTSGRSTPLMTCAGPERVRHGDPRRLLAVPFQHAHEVGLGGELGAVEQLAQRRGGGVGAVADGLVGQDAPGHGSTARASDGPRCSASVAMSWPRWFTSTK